MTRLKQNRPENPPEDGVPILLINERLSMPIKGFYSVRLQTYLDEEGGVVPQVQAWWHLPEFDPKGFKSDHRVTVTEAEFDPEARWGAELPETFDLPDDVDLDDEAALHAAVCDLVSANWSENCVSATFTLHG